MSELSKLKLVACKPVRTTSLKENRRRNLCNKLAEQLELARCMKSGATYEALATKRERDLDTSEFRTVKVPKRSRPWWWEAEDGKTYLTIRYGSRQIEIANGFNAIETDGIEGVIKSLDAVCSAVQSGELDDQIQRAACKTKVETTRRTTLTLPKK